MNKLVKLVLILLIFTSCTKEVKYPIYSLIKIDYVPDSLKVKQREWVKETIRAASQQMTGGDYEDVDETISQAKETADELFKVSVLGLRKQPTDDEWNYFYLRPDEMTPYEKTLLDSLVNHH